jgi:purine-nucleoside phosphorylase
MAAASWHGDPAPAVAWLRERLPIEPVVGIILGSGMGSLADAVVDAVRIPYAEIPGFPAAAVVGHAGVLVAGHLEGEPCVAFQGRFHLYEGHDPATVALPARVLVRLGVRALIITNAAGGVSRSMRGGDLMRIDDHLDLQGRSPLVGPVRSGETRFPDMSEPYDRRLLVLAATAAAGLGLPLRRGVYAAMLGPSYETPAEVRMLERLGAHAVGMSTVPEVVVARAAGVPVLGLSLITNPAAGLSPAPLAHEEVLEVAAAAAGDLARLVRAIVPRIPAALNA